MKTVLLAVSTLGLGCSARDVPSESLADVRQRIGVACVTPDLLPLAREKLPIGFYKDYTCFGSGLGPDDTSLSYLPVIQYKSKSDSAATRALLMAAWYTGQIPRLPDADVNELMQVLDGEQLGDWLVEHADGLPQGTLFLLGNEPGYQPSADDRTPAEIVEDAVIVRDIFDDHELDHRLALGGISTADNDVVRRAYGGRAGLDFFREILREAEGRVVFDAFVIHPYPSDFHPSVGDSKAQIVRFRELMDEFGQRDKDLIIGEVGLPFAEMDASEEAIAHYAEELLEFCLTASDADVGLPSDGNRLVQRITWFLLSPPTWELAGFTDNPGLDLARSSLMTGDGELTALGRSFASVVDRLATPRAAR